MPAEHVFMVLATALFGGAGAVLRFVLDGAVARRIASSGKAKQSFSWGLVVVNLSGSFCIGLLAALAASTSTPSMLLGVGFLGGYTTFSSASYDMVKLMRSGRVLASLVHGFGQLVGAVAFATLGYFVASMVAG